MNYHIGEKIQVSWTAQNLFLIFYLLYHEIHKNMTPLYSSEYISNAKNTD